MNVTARTAGVVTVLEVTGEIDGQCAPAFVQQVLASLAPEGRLLLDMAGVTFLSSAGLRALHLAHRQAAERRARLVLAAVSEDLRTTMSATGFLKFFTIRETVEDAVSVLE